MQLDQAAHLVRADLRVQLVLQVPRVLQVPVALVVLQGQAGRQGRGLQEQQVHPVRAGPRDRRVQPVLALLVPQDRVDLLDLPGLLVLESQVQLVPQDPLDLLDLLDLQAQPEQVLQAQLGQAARQVQVAPQEPEQQELPARPVRAVHQDHLVQREQV